MAQQHMLDRVREKFTALLNGYLPVPDVRDYIVRQQSQEMVLPHLVTLSLQRSFKIKHKIRLGNQTDFVVENNVFEPFLK